MTRLPKDLAYNRPYCRDHLIVTLIQGETPTNVARCLIDSKFFQRILHLLVQKVVRCGYTHAVEREQD